MAKNTRSGSPGDVLRLSALSDLPLQPLHLGRKGRRVSRCVSNQLRLSRLVRPRRNQHLPDGLGAGRKGRLFFFFVGGTLLVWRIRMGTIRLSNTCQRSRSTKPCCQQACGLSARLPGASQVGCGAGTVPAACLTRPAVQSAPRPFSGPGQDAGPLPKAHTFLAFLRVSEQLLQALFSCVDLFFIVPEIHPEAFGTQHRQSIQPKPQVHTNRALWDLGQVSWNDGPWGHTQ